MNKQKSVLFGRQMQRKETAVISFLAALIAVWAIPAHARVFDIRRTLVNLGPTGIEAQMVGDQLTAEGGVSNGDILRCFLVRKVRERSPAVGEIKIGDRILSVNGRSVTGGKEIKIRWRRDTFHPMLDTIGHAIEEAEGDPKRKGRIVFGIERGGKKMDVTVTLKQIGRFSKTYPVDCDKTDMLIRQGLAILEKTGNPRFFVCMAYLAQGTEKYQKLALPILLRNKAGVERRTGNLKEWVEGGQWMWDAAMSAIMMSEYTLATGDKQFVPTLKEYSKYFAEAHSEKYIYGHRGAINGKARGYGEMTFPTALVALSWALMEKCGVESDGHFQRTMAMLDATMLPDGVLRYGFGGISAWPPRKPSEITFSNSRASLSDLGRYWFVGIGNMGTHALVHHIKPWQSYSDKLVVNTVRGISRRRAQACAGHGAKWLHMFFGPLGCGLGLLNGEEEAFRLLCQHIMPYLNTCRVEDGSFYYQPTMESSKNGGIKETAVWVTVLSIPKHAIYVTGRDAVVPGVNKPGDYSSRTSSERSGSQRSSHKSKPAPVKAAPAIPEVDAEFMSQFDAALIERIKAVLASGVKPSFNLRMAKGKVQLKGIDGPDATGALVVETMRPCMEMKVQWKRLTLTDKRALALVLLRQGTPEDHALVAFYSLAIGDQNTAFEHFAGAGQGAEAVREAFKSTDE